jgi:HK97 family phage major capsid protein
MGAYLDRLNEQFDEIREGIDTLVNRAAEENRDVTEAEQKSVDRDRGRMDELTSAIEHYSAIDEKADRVTALRSRTPSARQAPANRPAPEAEYDVAREFNGPGDYAVTVHRATMLKDPAAAERLERATAHQKTTDNPGIIPRPVLGPVVDFLNTSRPFVNSCLTRPLPAGSFDRPTITQHVLVGEQAAEKDLTASQVLKIGKVPVTAKTFAGHLNISRQDIKWTNPGILNIVFDDFASQYAMTTCDYASDAFVTSVTGTAVPVDATGPDITAALYAAAAAAMTANGDVADTIWAAPDVWAMLGGIHNSQDAPSFPSLSVTNPGGNPLGLSLVVDSHFAAGTAIVGPRKFAEFYEDIDGLMQVGEPDVLGQLVGYAGFCAFVNINPGAFTKLTISPVVPFDSGASRSSKGK